MKRKAVIVVLGLAAVVSWALWTSTDRQSRAPSAPASVAVAPGRVATGPNVPSNPRMARPAPVARLPGGLSPIFGLAGESFAVRFKAAHSLKGPFSREDIKTLYLFLRTSGARPGTLIGGEHVLKNDVMDALCRQKPPPPDLLSDLCGLSGDAQQDGVTRDYAVQHIVSLCLQGTNQFVADRPAARELLWGTLAQTDGTLAGTALLGLHRLSNMDSEFDAARVSDMALKLVTEPGVGDLSRTTALQVCAQRQLAAMLPEAKRLAQSGNGAALRAAAVAALGDLGGEPERQMLKEFAKQDDPALQTAVAGALRRLSARLARAQTGAR